LSNEDKIGSVKIADEVIATCVYNAVMKTPGVSGFSGGFSDSFSKNILGKDPVHKGIKVNSSDEGVTIDLFLIVEYGIRIPTVAWDVQENVKKEVEAITDLPVASVNIHIMGVQFNKAAGASAKEE
jgi:uncharacterized alkaline shock family protein YloU